ncbi:MAG: heavy-metal-associated domain-containing protein [Clostridia bacterium]|nr:heavy-metal-associated domain-containing protein [Clostridia bacterium]
MFDKTENVVISVQGMHCNHCKAKVENALKALKGVKKFAVSLEEANASVDYVAKKTTPQEIAAAITAAGFNATL